MIDGEIPVLAHVLLLLVIGLVSAAAGYLVHRAWTERARSKPKRLDLIVVHMADETVIKGHFLEQGAAWLTLLEPQIMREDKSWGPVPGQAVLPLASISWLQKLPAA